MLLLIRIVAICAAVSVLGTLWFVAVFSARGGLSALFASGLLGVLTIFGWTVSLVMGPITAIQLWRLRESGRRAGIVLFGYGLGYYLVGLVVLRSPEASVPQIVFALALFALPLLVLLSPRTRLRLSADNTR
jgi:hypothetical protein